MSHLASDIENVTTSMVQDLCSAILNGLQEQEACFVAGIDPRRLAAWLQEGSEEGGRIECRELYAEIGSARAQYQQALIAAVRQDADKGAMWLLDRTFPQQWGQAYRGEVTVTHKGDSRSSITANMDENQIRELLDRGMKALKSSSSPPQITMTRTTDTVTIGENTSKQKDDAGDDERLAEIIIDGESDDEE